MTLGQKIHVKRIGNAARYSKEIETCTISKIGRKYFEVEEMRNRKFFIETLLHSSGQYSPDYKCYLSLQEINDEEEQRKLHDKVKKHFNNYFTSLPLDKLREIKGNRVHIKVSGLVVRANEKGMGICFDEKYEINPLDD